MVIRDINEITKDALKITIVPNLNVNDITQEKLKKFKWEFKKFDKNLLTIQIIFDFPSYVSYQGLDVIQIEVVSNKLFEVDSDNERRMLAEHYLPIYLPQRYTMVHTFPKQFSDKETALAVKTVMEGT